MKIMNSKFIGFSAVYIKHLFTCIYKLIEPSVHFLSTFMIHEHTKNMNIRVARPAYLHFPKNLLAGVPSGLLAGGPPRQLTASNKLT